MGISIAVQNQIHERVRVFHGPVATTLSEMALEAPAGTMIGEIHAYAETMFNSIDRHGYLWFSGD
ncbi:hypothetical protein [Nocardia sp. NPDC050717]|uniref:hypothetical protein n=1 Tax=Nocardia sp. NPDC050717 TaxID=3157221 RepID=UPI0033CD125D